MTPDYPAAHSMDSSWYAVDEQGHVALFLTGAGGAVPEAAYSPEASELLEEAGLEDENRHTLPDDQLPDQKHLFLYRTGPLDECLADRYQRRRTPKQPLHVDQLPPEVRQAIGGVCFALDFSQTKVIQPIELTACATWDAAYLSGDGKMVKPVPGREEEYAAFFATLQADLAEDGLTFEEPS